MNEARDEIDLGTSLGYLLKEVASALRAAMEDALRPLGMSVTHYSCLEVLAQRPGLSSAELARATFVTRQSMHVLLQRLEREGQVVRATVAPSGRSLPSRLTPQGEAVRARASAAVREVEVRMQGGMSEADRAVVLRVLRGAARSLRASAETDLPGESLREARA